MGSIMRAASRFASITSIVLILLPQPGLSLFAGHQTRGATERQSIRYLLRSFVSAWNRNDAEAVAQLFLNDGKFISTSGSEAASRAEIVEALRREHYETFTGTTLSMRLATIRSFKDGVAVAEGTYELSGVDLFLGLTTSVTGSFTFRLANQNDRWMIEQAQVKRS
jgi:uncharacterized protein (TIGR02246 family)